MKTSNPISRVSLLSATTLSYYQLSFVRVQRALLGWICVRPVVDVGHCVLLCAFRGAKEEGSVQVEKENDGKV